MSLGGPHCNTWTLLYLSLNVFIFALVNNIIEQQIYNHPIYLSSKKTNSLLCHAWLLLNYLLFSSVQSRWTIFFLISNLLGRCILILPLSHLPPWSMAWNKTDTCEETLQVSFSRTVTLDRAVAEGVRRVSLDPQRIQILWRQETGKHPWMKGDFNRAQNVPLKKQQTLLTLYNSVKQNNSHL